MRLRGIQRKIGLLETIEQVTDRNLVPWKEASFFNEAAVDPDPVSTAEVANRRPVVSQNETAMPSRNLGQVDSNVTLRVASDQEERPIERDRRDRPGD